jgi:hypothetical protein
MIVTTEGSWASATEVTLHEGAAAVTATDGLLLEFPMTAPTTPAAISTTSARVHGMSRRPRACL